MKLRSIAAFGVTVLAGQTVLAQPAPTAPSPQPAPTFAPAPPPTFAPAPSPAPAPPSSQAPRAQPAPSVPPPATWGSGVAPAPSAQPAPTVMPSPYPAPPGAYPPPGYGYPPGGYPGWGSSDGTPTAIGPDGRPHLLPLEMKYDPDKGIPPGYRLAEKRRTGIAVAGASILGGLWIASAIAGGIMEDSGRFNGAHGWPMYIPVLGPFITIESYNTSSGGATPLVFDGLGQAAGLVMFIYGMASKEKVLKYQFDTPAAQLEVTPVASPLQNGGFAGLSGTF